MAGDQINSVRYIRARHVATMSAAGVIEDGCVAISSDRVVELGSFRDLRPRKVDVDIDGLLTPGLINAHTHLELTLIPRLPKPKNFQEWLVSTMAAAGRDVPAAVLAGIAQCQRFGVTAVGDISQNVDLVRPVLRTGLPRAISYGECLGVGMRQARFDALLARAIDVTSQSDQLLIGISPHAPYTVETEDFARVLAIGMPVTTHLAESPDERIFFESRQGPFREMYRQLGFNPGIIGGSWPQLLSQLFDAGVLCAHMNYLTEEEIALAGKTRARIVWCPRTHQYFGHPPHPWRKLIAAGAIVCIGTDSAASAGDLNVMDDLRLIHRQAPEVLPEDLWPLVTTTAAQAMNIPPTADFVAWPTRSNDPLAEVLDTPGMLPTADWSAALRSLLPARSGD